MYRFCTDTCSELYQILPTFRFVMRRSWMRERPESWLRETVAPLMVVPGSRLLERIRHLRVEVIRVAALDGVAQRQVRHRKRLIELLTSADIVREPT